MPLKDRVQQCIALTQPAIQNDPANHTSKEAGHLIERYRYAEKMRKKSTCCAIEPVSYQGMAVKYSAPLHQHLLVRIDYLETVHKIKSRNDNQCYGMLMDIYQLLNQKQQMYNSSLFETRRRFFNPKTFKQKQLNFEKTTEITVFARQLVAGRPCFSKEDREAWQQLEISRADQQISVKFELAKTIKFECQTRIFGQASLKLPAGKYSLIGMQAELLVEATKASK